MNVQVAFLLLRCWYLLAPVSSWGQGQIALDFTATPTKHNNKASSLFNLSLFPPCRATLLCPTPLFTERICCDSVNCCEDQGGIPLAPSANSRFGSSWHYIIHIICISGRLAASQLSCNFSASFCFPVKTFLS